VLCQEAKGVESLHRGKGERERVEEEESSGNLQRLCEIINE
jgi:hypothetical protein